jgi:hypothetical protein
MSEDSIRLIVGPIPIALTILSIYSYVRGLVSRKNNNSIIFFTTLLISSFFVTLLFYWIYEPRILLLLASQCITAISAYALLKIAILRGENEPALLAKPRKGPEALAKMAAASSVLVFILDFASPLLARKCSGPRCEAFEFVFGTLDGNFQPYYLLNFLCGMMLIPIALSVYHILKSH